MSPTQTADEILDRTYLEIRAHILKLAAALDRVKRADGSDHVENDPRMEKIHKSIEILNDPGFDRAEKMQLIFSDPYQPGWNKAE